MCWMLQQCHISANSRQDNIWVDWSQNESKSLRRSSWKEKQRKSKFLQLMSQKNTLDKLLHVWRWWASVKKQISHDQKDDGFLGNSSRRGRDFVTFPVTTSQKLSQWPSLCRILIIARDSTTKWLIGRSDLQKKNNRSPKCWYTYCGTELMYHNINCCCSTSLLRSVTFLIAVFFDCSVWDQGPSGTSDACQRSSAKWELAELLCFGSVAVNVCRILSFKLLFLVRVCLHDVFDRFDAAGFDLQLCHSCCKQNKNFLRGIN